MGFIYNIKSKHSRECAEYVFANILAYTTVFRFGTRLCTRVTIKKQVMEANCNPTWAY